MKNLILIAILLLVVSLYDKTNMDICKISIVIVSLGICINLGYTFTKFIKKGK